MRTFLFAAFALAAIALVAGPTSPGARAADAPHVVAGDSVATGRYLVNYGGCNDCHTPGWSEAPGTIPESKRLTGATVGFQGPWGVWYPANLRLQFSQMSVSRWLALVKSPGAAGHPPMPWFDVQSLSESVVPMKPVALPH